MHTSSSSRSSSSSSISELGTSRIVVNGSGRRAREAQKQGDAVADSRLARVHRFPLVDRQAGDCPADPDLRACRWLFVCGTEETMQPCPLCLHAISLAVQCDENL